MIKWDLLGAVQAPELSFEVWLIGIVVKETGAPETIIKMSFFNLAKAVEKTPETWFKGFIDVLSLRFTVYNISDFKELDQSSLVNLNIKKYNVFNKLIVCTINS